MDKGERVTLKDAAKELGVSPQAVREHLKKGIWSFGMAVYPEKTGKKIWEYYIYRRPLDKFLGKTE